MPKPKEFTIWVHRPGQRWLMNRAGIDLPASPAELLDLFQKARVNNERDVYEVELLFSRRECLWDALEDQTLGVHELNLLAWRLSGLEGYEEGLFEGLCKMEDTTPDVARLINMTYSLQDCAAAWDIRDDEALGRWSFENDFVEELVEIPDEAAKYLDYAKIGRERRVMEHGVFTADGYVVNLNYPNLKEHHKPGELAAPMLPSAGLVVFLRSIAEPQKHWPGGATLLKLPDTGAVEIALPVSEKELADTLSRLGCNIDELEVIPKDCLVPSMLRHIRPDEDIGALNAFAVCCKALHSAGKLPLYKAVLAATGCTSIAEAAELGAHIDEYRLDTELSAPTAYALQQLEKTMGLVEAHRLANAQDLTCYGRGLIEKNNVTVTDYGYLTRADGEPVLAQATEQAQETASEQPTVTFEQTM